MHILIVKHGALGDVVRTSYFAESLRLKYGDNLRLSWVTSPNALPLLRFNPYIDDLWTSFDCAVPHKLDVVFSLDEEFEILESCSRLSTKGIVGAFIDSNGNRQYSEDSGAWFDMGLISRFGKRAADNLKKQNTLSHSQIFSEILCVPSVRPSFYGLPRMERFVDQVVRCGSRMMIGVNSYAGGRWPSKELPKSEQLNLIYRLLFDVLGKSDKLLLIGAGGDRLKNEKIASEIGDPRIIVPNTDHSLFKLAAMIKSLDYLITSDSLAMHLAISQGVRSLAFFTATSANEIDDFGILTKYISTSNDYCSYQPNADNSSIKSEEIIKIVQLNFK